MSWKHGAQGLLLAASLAACAAPSPAVAKQGPTSMPHWLREMRAQRVEVDVGNGEKLRGIFVPPAYGEPLCLHFLGSPLAAAGSKTLLQEFNRRGAGSLILDPRGVGESDGVLDQHHFPEDSLAAWKEAVRRMEGKSEDVRVRAIGLGNLQALSLLEQGSDPATITFIAPLDARAGAEEWTRTFGGNTVPDSSRLEFDLARVSSSHRTGLMLIFLGAPRDSAELAEQATLRETSKTCGAAVFDDDRSQVELAQGAPVPLKLESELLFYRSPYGDYYSGFCALMRPDIDVLDLSQASGTSGIHDSNNR